MDRIERLAELGRDRTACIVAFPEDYDVTLVLRKDVALDRVPTLGRTPAVRTLDVARIETLVVQYILGAGTATPSLAYTPDPRGALPGGRPREGGGAGLLHPPQGGQGVAGGGGGGGQPPPR